MEGAGWELRRRAEGEIAAGAEARERDAAVCEFQPLSLLLLDPVHDVFGVVGRGRVGVFGCEAVLHV